jgi:prepilin-type N-terminal cleavage/methylation domain-containing protein
MILRNTSAGYSLVELLVVLAIISLILLVALPAGGSAVERMTLSADARALADDLRALRTRALDQQTDIVVTRERDTSLLVTSEGRRLGLSVGTDAAIVSGDGRFTLRWNGTASGAIWLTRGPSSVRLNADQLTGRIALEVAR